MAWGKSIIIPTNKRDKIHSFYNLLTDYFGIPRRQSRNVILKCLAVFHSQLPFSSCGNVPYFDIFSVSKTGNKITIAYLSALPEITIGKRIGKNEKLPTIYEQRITGLSSCNTKAISYQIDAVNLSRLLKICGVKAIMKSISIHLT